MFKTDGQENINQVFFCISGPMDHYILWSCSALFMQFSVK